MTSRSSSHTSLLPARIGQALARSSTKLRRWGDGAAYPPAMMRAEQALARLGGRDFAKRNLRIPVDALIPVDAGSPALPCASETLRLEAPKPSVANDNLADPSARKKMLRDLLFLLLLFATVAGAFYSGRLHAKQTIIVVPEPAAWRGTLALNLAAPPLLPGARSV